MSMATALPRNPISTTDIGRSSQMEPESITKARGANTIDELRVLGLGPSDSRVASCEGPTQFTLQQEFTMLLRRSGSGPGQQRPSPCEPHRKARTSKWL